MFETVCEKLAQSEMYAMTIRRGSSKGQGEFMHQSSESSIIKSGISPTDSMRLRARRNAPIHAYIHPPNPI